MMTDSEFAALCYRLGLPKEAIDLVRKIRTAPPAFRVEGGYGNVCGSYPCRRGSPCMDQTRTKSTTTADQGLRFTQAMARWCQGRSFRTKQAPPRSSAMPWRPGITRSTLSIPGTTMFSHRSLQL